jgi:hypothetical protein
MIGSLVAVAIKMGAHPERNALDSRHAQRVETGERESCAKVIAKCPGCW